jgi:hypothetical protein
MNPWLWEVGQARRRDLWAEARRHLGDGPLERACPRDQGWSPAGARLGKPRPTFPRKGAARGTPRWARASAWAGHRMIAFGCRLVRPALVAGARAEM